MPVAENGWTTVPLSSTTTFLAPNGKIVYCRDHDVATILGYVAWRWHTEVEHLATATHLEGDPDVRQGLVVIHAWRPAAPIAGTKPPIYSNHGAGMAMDVNGHLHPYEFTAPKPYRDGFTQAQRDKLRQIRRDIIALGADVLRLGIDFTVGRRDGMHVELVGTATQVARAARGIRDAGWLIPTRRGEIAAYQAFVGVSADDWHGTGTSDAVKKVQRRHGLVADGIWGRATRTAAVQARLADLGYQVGPVDGIPGPLYDTALKSFQRAHGLEVDAIAGPATLTALTAARPVTPDPAPTPTPAVPVHRVAGPGRFDTAAAADETELPPGTGVILYVDGTPDAAAAVLLGARTGHRTLPVRADDVPAPIARRLHSLAPAWVAVVGGPNAFPERTAQAAAQAAATK